MSLLDISHLSSRSIFYTLHPVLCPVRFIYMNHINKLPFFWRPVGFVQGRAPAGYQKADVWVLVIYFLDSKVKLFLKWPSLHIFLLLDPDNYSFIQETAPRHLYTFLTPLFLVPLLNLFGLSLKKKKKESTICFLLELWLIHISWEENCKETVKKEQKHGVRDRSEIGSQWTPR